MRVGVCGPTGGRTSKLSRMAATHGLELIHVEQSGPRPEDIWLVVMIGQAACQRLFEIDLSQAVGHRNWIDGRLWTAIGEGTEGLIDFSWLLSDLGITGDTIYADTLDEFDIKARLEEHMTAGWADSEKAIIGLHEKGKLRAIKEVNKVKKLLNVTLQYWR